MDTEKLLSILPVKQVAGAVPPTVTDIAIDSRAVNAGGVFVCIEGFTVDGHKYVEKAVDNGARVIIASKHVDVDLDKVAVVRVENTSRAISLLAPQFYNFPSKRMTMIGVTGTNGKTSVSGIIQAILQLAGEASAVTGTIGFDLDGTLYETENTTADVLSTQGMIAHAAEEGCTTMTMEVSSHGLVEGRLAGTEFDIAVFTNLTHDHLDFHGTMDNYGQAKGLLFSQLGQDLQKRKFAVVNADDEWSNRLLEMTSHPVLTYGIRNEAVFRGSDIELRANGTTFKLTAPGGEFRVVMNLIGEFSVYNALAVIAALFAKGMATEDIINYLGKISSVKGRMEQVPTELPITMYVDYAHSADAIEKAIDAVLPYKKEGSRLIFVIGTGGNRDRIKRPIMAEKASVADYVVLTTDDPRDEPYESILAELEAGMKHDQYACIGDRKEAVRHAVAVANPEDIIIFAGKGHEDYQIIGSVKYPHSDADIALEEAEKKFGTGFVNK
ncbi:UDP-N-acetylmuramoyl-L-alanyl-D-glutamate--2,6-diaminopimelate ligase [Sporosarcina sp. ANT_H38]|uniref:UDP-N-acetylmuramoyl-L-alanyl-D-glutamate--2, 6-diaminopimelate ligase n=1 Tax=Sporosarcina sp. ANT_H38 TaxID=2597358 RepID=UPI0011F283BA|nr:UDP-N-acetylmuramoyl-L-alanyl-D-glutamate--2,6-diaminopimelate ligase [Sporosarcina sp. ANT_H38]KAA0966694.1 UDP-N-acetylmuramoyl-L-alanyl-D-glutamate--2,6-diaminopimelate ligase [Sporosarcina sp. ANT_H38]